MKYLPLWRIPMKIYPHVLTLSIKIIQIDKASNETMEKSFVADEFLAWMSQCQRGPQNGYVRDGCLFQESLI
jgi:hypothetical protein